MVPSRVKIDVINQDIPEEISKRKLQAMGYVFDVDRIIENVATKFLLTSKRCSKIRIIIILT